MSRVCNIKLEKQSLKVVTILVSQNQLKSTSRSQYEAPVAAWVYAQVNAGALCSSSSLVLPSDPLRVLLCACTYRRSSPSTLLSTLTFLSQSLGTIMNESLSFRVRARVLYGDYVGYVAHDHQTSTMKSVGYEELEY